VDRTVAPGVPRPATPPAPVRGDRAAGTAKGSVALAERFGIELLWLPKRAPKLNPMDTLWGQGKDVICADTQYATRDEQVNRFTGYLLSLSGRDALHTAGILSKDFWLASVL
jgi:hypothetical protein